MFFYDILIMVMKMKKVMLMILDGFGLRDEVYGNAVKQANKPNFDYLWNNYPHSTLDASGEFVGLPKGQMGNSETGHLNIGAGRIVYQPLEYINNEIRTGNMFNNKELLNVMNYAKENNKKLHFLGLVSDGGIHSSINHLKSLLSMAKENNVNNIYIHAITDGRDTFVDSGYGYLKEIMDLNIGSIATICGRYYTMDRDKNYDRLEKGFNLITKGVGKEYSNLKDVFEDSYSNKIYDEFIEPSILDKNGLINEGDAVIWFNFRPDRARQILSYLINVTSNIVSMMEVSSELKIPYAFKLEDMDNTLGMYLSKNNIRQLRIAETEKYAHVTYFFDGGKELNLPNCDKILINSPKVKTYDLLPEMSAYEITDKLLSIINNYDYIILNFANCDMVGHTGNLDATIKAVESVDYNLGRIYNECVKNDITLVVTADHGNAELMIDNDGNIITTHTTNKVPFIVCDNDIAVKSGALKDIAPTMLKLGGLIIPKEMTGDVLIERGCNNN